MWEIVQNEIKPMSSMKYIFIQVITFSLFKQDKKLVKIYLALLEENESPKLLELLDFLEWD